MTRHDPAPRLVSRIAFDGRAFSSPAGGVRRYVTELCAALTRIAPDVALVAVGGPADLVLPQGVTAVRASPTLPSSLGWAAVGLPLSARRTRFDVFHAPAYVAPLWGIHPVALTIHDVSYARRPEWYPHASDWRRQAFYRRSARRADAVITDSAFSREEIVAAYALAPERITVIPLGAGSAFRPDASVRRELFVLHVGDLHERRNLAMLLEVVLALKRDEPRLRDLALVLIGTDRGVLESLVRRASEAGAPGALRALHHLDDEQLAGWYRRAALLAYPSRYEGFGLPVLEAMACATPVIATSAGAVPEVVGDACPVIAPDDRSGWSAAIERVLLDEPHARRAGERALERSRTFSWERTARETLAVYQSLI